MSKKWGYKAGESRIFDVTEGGDLPEGWSTSPVTDTGAEKGKGSEDPPAPVTDTGAEKVAPTKGSSGKARK